MKSKIVFWLLVTVLLTTPIPADAQQPAKVPRIGYLTNASLSAGAANIESFRHGLRDLGYVEGKSIVIERRSGEGNRDRQRTLAADLVRLNVDVIVAGGSGDILAAKAATATTPIVMVQSGDPVGSGFVASLARPGGNITGLSVLRPELSGKRLEFLNEIVPRLSRLGVFLTSDAVDHAQVLRELDLAAGAFGVKLHYMDVLSPKNVESAFQAAIQARVDAVLFKVSSPVFTFQRPQITELAVKNRLPVMYERAAEAEAGGLMSYGVSVSDLYRRAATYVDKIVKGANPGDLPVEQPTKFELVMNLKAAKQIGLTIPASVLARADKVIK